MTTDRIRPQAVLNVSENLVYPVKSRQVSKPYSEGGVYSKTLHDYRAHTGCDFTAEEGENIYAMCAGTVKDISVSELYGVIIEVDCGDFYGLLLRSEQRSSTCEKGQQISTAIRSARSGIFPCESDEAACAYRDPRRRQADRSAERDRLRRLRYIPDDSAHRNIQNHCPLEPFQGKTGSSRSRQRRLLPSLILCSEITPFENSSQSLSWTIPRTHRSWHLL